VILRPVDAGEAAALARVHAASFEAGWSAAAFAELLASPGAFALAAETDGALHGFILARAIAGEAEILTLAVLPEKRRRGVAGALVEAAAGAAAALGAGELFLEVAADNPAAIALYKAAGFAPAGRRRGYYARPHGARIDALVLRRVTHRD